MTTPAPERTPEFHANAFECLDCDEFYDGDTECPEEPSEHGGDELMVTENPVFSADGSAEADLSAWNFGRKQYEFTEEAFKSVVKALVAPADNPPAPESN